MKRLVVIGLGSRVRWLLKVLDTFNADIALVGAVDPNHHWISEKFPELVTGVTFYDNVDTALDQAEPDAVMIGTTCEFHTNYAKKVLARGLPLYLEKPVSINESQLQELYEASRTTASQVVVSFPLRLTNLCLAAKEVIESGVVGTIENIQAVNNVPFYGSNYYHGWMRDDSRTGGLWLQKATHDLDYISFLAGQLPVRMVAVESKNVFTGDMPANLHCLDCEKYSTCPESQWNLFSRQGIITDMHEAEAYWEGRWKCCFAVDTGNHDSATAIMQYADGSHATYTQCFYARRSAAKRGVIMTGYAGTVSFDFYGDEVTVVRHQTPRVDHHKLEAIGNGHGGGDFELIKDFVGIIHGTGQSRATLEDGITSAQLCLTAKKSCETNAFIPFSPLVNQAQTIGSGQHGTNS